MLKEPESISLPEALTMVQSVHAHLRVVMDTLLGRDHPSSQSLESFIHVLTDMDMEFEEYSIWYRRLKPHLLSLLTR